MTISMSKVAAVLALLVGALSVIAGRQAALGWDPGYSVISWLPLYNLGMGVWTSLVPAILIWRGNGYGMMASIATLATHAVVLLLLLSNVFGEPAAQSIIAMLFRVVTWVVILGLLRLHSRRLEATRCVARECSDPVA
jgi:hypothetical protein